MTKYSFIIPVKEINDYIRESIPKILEIARNDFEIIIYPDQKTKEIWPKTRQISSGSGGPAMKRGLALRDALGDFLIFIDDDAYPKKNILEILDEDFKNEFIAAVGGPAITPKNDNFFQKVSGAVFLSTFSGGFPERYISIGKRRFIKDWPSVNLSVRKNVFFKIGGFKSQFWPGEDTKFCLDIIHQLEEKNKILYDPKAIVWHHRRGGLKNHLRQVGGYGIHRGFFAKTLPETSFKLKYFIPSAFSVFSIMFPFAIMLYLKNSPKFNWMFDLFIIGWFFYFLAMIITFFQIQKHEKNIFVSFYAIYYTFLTHIWYGIRFIQGFAFTKELKSKLR